MHTDETFRQFQLNFHIYRFHCHNSNKFCSIHSQFNSTFENERTNTYEYYELYPIHLDLCFRMVFQHPKYATHTTS